jgi:hypothetical protein
MSKRKASIETSNIWDKLRAEKEEEGFDGKEIEAYIQSYADTLMATAPPIVLPQLGSTRLRLDLGSASAQLKTPFSQVEAGSCGLRLGSGLKPAQAGQLQIMTKQFILRYYTSITRSSSTAGRPSAPADSKLSKRPLSSLSTVSSSSVTIQ